MAQQVEKASRSLIQSMFFGVLSLMMMAMTGSVAVYAAPALPWAWLPTVLLGIATSLCLYLAFGQVGPD